MNTEGINKRNSALDIIRVVAVFSVISVHFLRNIHFYSQPVVGTRLYIMCIMRTLFSVCVPLFIILTGYLMCKKTLSEKYYIGIKKTLLIYLLASICCILFNIFYLKTPYSAKDFVLNILNFKGAAYSWYIEMYIGLFLMIPFLNLIYNNLTNKKQKLILVFTFICLTALPSLFNIYNFSETSWLRPSETAAFDKLIPGWWVNLYPITFYFAGCYIREYGLKLKTRTLAVLFIICTGIFGSFNYYRSYGTIFKTTPYINWSGFEPLILSVLLFTILCRIKGEKLPLAARRILWKISDLALCMYLVSYIFDSYAYEKLNTMVNPMPMRLSYYFIIVPFVFVCSMILSAIITFAEKYIDLALTQIVYLFKRHA